MSLSGLLGGDTPKEPEKPTLTPEQQEVYDTRIKNIQKFIDDTLKTKKENVGSFPQIFTPQYAQIIDEGTQAYKKLVEDNPTLNDIDFNKKVQNMPFFTNFSATLDGAFYTLYLFKFFSTIVKTNAEELLRQKKITEAQKKELDDKADEIQKYYDSITNQTPLLEVITKFSAFSGQLYEIYRKAKVDDPLSAIKGNSRTSPVEYRDSILALTKNIKVAAKKIEEEKVAEKASFSVKRLANEILNIMGATVGSLLIVMLFLVSGMLTANDAIGRDWKYRVLYFFYGGLGFPLMLIYYLYRWFTGSAPHIYRLLPIYTEESDTSLGRFLFFPFTYKEDNAAREATKDFMTKAAEFVGKEYKAPADAGDGKSSMSGVLKAMEALGVSKEAADLAAKGAEVVAKGVEATAATLETVVDKMKGIELKQTA